MTVHSQSNSKPGAPGDSSGDSPHKTVRPKKLAALSDHRTDPLVERFVTTDDPLASILEAQPEPRSLIVQALLYIQECLDGKRLAKDAVNLAQAVPLTGWDPELLILFLSNWAELSRRVGRPSTAETLLHRARSIVTDETHPEIIAAIMLVEGSLADTTGNKTRAEDILASILKTVSKHSARRKFYVWEHVLFLAMQGRAQDVAEEARELSWQSNDRYRASRLLIVQFIDAMETGQAQKAAEAMTQLKSGIHRPRDMTRFPLRDYQALLAMMHNGSDMPGDPGTEEDSAEHPRVTVIRSLLGNRPEEALRAARVEASRVLGSIFASGFESFNLIRAELASGNAESAQRLLQMRRTRGNVHYLDSLFFARAELLQKQPKKAAHHFGDLLGSIEHYRAKGRLDFELRLACELDAGAILRLTQEAERSRKRSLGVYTLRKKDGDSVSSNTLTRHASGTAAHPAGDTPAEGDEEATPGVNAFRGRSSVAEEVRQAITRFAGLEAPVLITGETGTGKELVARALHAASPRAGAPFLAINCGAITESLLESELFGHERGAFTGAEKATRGLFEAAGTGTILLDEIGDITPRLQASLLRVLETGEIRAVGSTQTRTISCRVLAATNVDLEQAVADGHFREDLLYRLQRLGIHLPALRDRPDDILVLTRYFLDTGRRIGQHAVLSKRIRTALRDYAWPGNIRELKNVVERMRLMHSDKLSYDIGDLDLRFRPAGADPAEGSVVSRPRPAARVKAKPQGDTGQLSPARAAAEAVMPTAPPAPPPSPAATNAESVEARAERIVSTGNSTMRRLERLKALFAQYRRLTRKEVIGILDISPNTATKYLKILCDEGQIRMVEPNSSTRTRYFEQVDAKDSN